MCFVHLVLAELFRQPPQEDRQQIFSDSLFTWKMNFLEGSDEEVW